MFSFQYGGGHIPNLRPCILGVRARPAAGAPVLCLAPTSWQMWTTRAGDDSMVARNLGGLGGGCHDVFGRGNQKKIGSVSGFGTAELEACLRGKEVRSYVYRILTIPKI